VKKLIGILLVVALSLMIIPAVVGANGAPTIDGVIDTGEWDGHLWFDETLTNTFTNPANMLIHIYVMSDADNLYVALDIPDTFDMRTHPEVAEGASDTFSLNIGVEGEARSYSRILQFNTKDRTGDPNWFTLDGYFAQWAEATSEANTSPWGPDVEYLPIPAGVQSKTIIGAGGRVQEIAIPLSDLGVTPGTVIRIGGCIRAAEFEGYNFHALYPAGLDWGDASTYKDFFLVPPPPTPVDIDIKPGSDPNSINLKSKGVVPVAVLTTDDFDASTVDPDTVEFAGAEPVRWTMEDVDGDGDMDMLFHFKTQELNLDGDSTEATLTGETVDGVQIEGTDTVNIVPKGKK